MGLSLGMQILSGPAFAAEDGPPQVSKDGLQLTKQTGTRLVYRRPGATFSQYKRVAILVGQRATSVSNLAAAQQIMQSWAAELRKRLDIATGKSTD